MQKLPKFAVTLLALACTLGHAWADEQGKPAEFGKNRTRALYYFR